MGIPIDPVYGYTIPIDVVYGYIDSVYGSFGLFWGPGPLASRAIRNAFLLSIGGPEMVGLGDGGFASRPRGWNHQIGKKSKRFNADRRSAWTATPLEPHANPIGVFSST